MNIKFLKSLINWRSVLNAARTTVGKKNLEKDPSSNWKKKILLAEHSPIRLIIVNWKWSGIKYWVSVHFVRHKIGIEHFVKTQRSDRTGVERDGAPQDALVDHECVANAQSIINISRKRLCFQASLETREAWKLFIDNLRDQEPDLYSVCVPECIYRGFCVEPNSCGYSKTDNYLQRLKEYRSLSPS